MVATTADLVVNGSMAQALDVCRRLLRTGSSVQCVETAQLVLERLRSGGTDDSSDDVNALLRLLGNYVTPTRELTEEILSLLLFCDHRVLLVHHLPKLTYQSKECMELVVQAYLELLATDRSSLVPVLGSLAEMPLDTSEKNTVVEATQSLLDAAEESDIPAVVQSLLSMVTKLSAPKALGRLRTECNRIQSGTLSLTMEVIGRFASAGSVALAALLRLIRHVEPLTTFDILSLTLVMGKSAENELAVRTTTSIAQSGRIYGRLMREAAMMLVRPEWTYLLPSFVQFCSCLLATCFRASTRVTLASNLISSSVDSFIVLIETASIVHEEALILLLKIASQPKKLLLLANADSVQRTRSTLCWNVAEAIALRLLELARRNAGALASSSHLFLDHLHGIASATTVAERYPSHILDLLCSTMALLTKKERGIYSLLMITIQKQLVTRVGAFGLPHDQQSFRLQSGRSLQSRASAVEVKQLMAVLLAGHLLKNQVVIESRDRKTLANWMLRLLASANRDETLLHVLEFVRDEMNRSREVSALEQERALLTPAIFQVFRKKGLCWTSRDEVLQRVKEDNSVVIAYDDVTSARATDCNGRTTLLVLDATDFVFKLRFGVLSFSFGKMSQSERDVHQKLLEREYLTKMCLLRELFHCYMCFATPIEQSEIVGAACLLPSAYKQALSAEACGSIEPVVLNTVIWNLVCALDVAVASTNFAAKQYSAITDTPALQQGRMDQHARMTTRLNICLKQRNHLAQILARQKVNIVARLESMTDTANLQCTRGQKDELEWMLQEASVAEQLLNGELRRVQKEPPRGSLSGLDFRVICLVFEGQFGSLPKPTLSVDDELELLQVFSQHLQNNAISSSGFDGSSDSSGNLKLLVSMKEGRCTVKWLCHRAAELSHMISNDNYGDDLKCSADEDSEVVSAEAVVARARTRQSLAYSLAYIYDSFILLLEECRIANTARDSTWTEKMMKLLAAGASPGDDSSRIDKPYGCDEVFFRFLARQCLELTDPTLASLVIDALVSLVLNTKKSPLVSQLCLALLHQTFPAAPTLCQFDAFAGKFLRDLPLRSLSKAVVSPVSGRVCSLAKYRCTSMKWRHIAYLVVGAWAFTASASSGSFLLAQFLEEMRALIDAAASDNGERNGQKKRTADMDESEDESDENDLDEGRYQDELAVVANGEHVVLKNLTNESLPFFIEAVLLCAIASLHRAAPKKSSTQALADMNPFMDYCRAMNVFGSALRVFAQAEACGFNLPSKTNLLVLRGGAFAMRSVRSILTKCVAWRIDQSVSDSTGALEHLVILFGAAYAMSVAMEKVTHTFQERVVLKMQRNGRRRGWSSELLAKVYGRKYNAHRLISKTEAKLVPFFSHGIQELQDFLHGQSNVNNINLEAAMAQWEAVEDIWGNVKYRDVMLSGDKLVRACQTLQTNELTSALLKDWRPAVLADTDDDETDDDDEEELAGTQEGDEESLSEEEDDGFVVRSGVATSTNQRALLSDHKNLAVGLQDNGDLGFPTIVVNFKKQKKTHK